MCKKKMIIEVMCKADYCLLCYYMVKTMGEILSEYTEYTEYPMVDLLGATPANYLLKETEIKYCSAERMYLDKKAFEIKI